MGSFSLPLPLSALAWLTYTHTYTRKIRCHHRALFLAFPPTVMRRSRTFDSCSFALFCFFSKRYLQFMAVFCILSRLSFFFCGSLFLSPHIELEIAHFWAATADSLDHFPLELQVSLIRMRECAKHTHTILHVCVHACVLWFCAWLPRSFYIAYCMWHTFCCCCCWAQMVRSFDRLTLCFLSFPTVLLLLPIKMSNTYTYVYKINKSGVHTLAQSADVWDCSLPF